MQFIPDRHVSESTVFVFDISIGVLCNLTIHGKPYMYFIKYVNSIRSVMRFGLNYRRIPRVKEEYCIRSIYVYIEHRL